MNNQKKQAKSPVVPILLAVVAVLVILVGVASFFAFRGNGQEALPANTSNYPEGYQAQFAQVWERNNDFKGYLTLEGTALATTVVQSTDNVTYTQKDFDGNAGKTAFLDYRADLSTTGGQVLVYLPDAGVNAMYGEMANYKSIEYYKAHPVVTFNTVHQDAKYKIFAVVYMEEGSELIPYQTCMPTADAKQLTTLVQKAMENSLLRIPVDVMDNDEILTIMAQDPSLVDAAGKPAQVLVFARKVRAGESEAVDTSGVLMNPNKNMSQQWFEQILRAQNEIAVSQQIRTEAAKWFTAYELQQIEDADLELRLEARKNEFKKFLSEQELQLSAEEKLYLYESRKQASENPVLTLNAQDLIGRVGDEITLTAALAPKDDNAVYTWTSSNDNVVSVTGTGSMGRLNAKKVGNATITVTSGKASASCTIEVRAAEAFVLNPASKTLFKGESFTINASSEIAKVVSGNEKVASVSFRGSSATVTGKSNGTATITVTAKTGATATCKVTVENYKLTLDASSLRMERGNIYNISVTKGEAVNWYSGNSGVAKVKVVKTGKVAQIEAVGTGTTTITATARNGAQATCTITVSDKDISISTSMMDLKVGDLRDIRVTKGTITRWVSTNESIAKVYEVGDGSYAQVEGVGRGVATIRAIGQNGSVAECSVTVSEPAQSLIISPYSMVMTQGDMRNISVTNGHASSWVSSNPNVAQVYVVGDGSMAQVEAFQPGSTTITVYDNYGGWVTCNVTVESAVSRLAIGPGSAYLNIGDWLDISVTSGVAVDWVSTNPDVAPLFAKEDGTKMSVRADAAGTTQIIAYAADGSTAVCNVTVNAPASQPLSLSTSSVALAAGEWFDLSVLSGHAVNWDSSDSNVCGVFVTGGDTQNVKIKGDTAGTARIIAYAADGTTAVCNVTITAPAPQPQVQPLSLSTNSVYLTTGEWFDLSVVSGIAVNWDSSNSNVCGVYVTGGDTQNVRIKGDIAGTARIIAYAADGTTAVCNVTMEDPYVPEEVFAVESAPAPVSEPLVIGPSNIEITEGDWSQIRVASGDARDWATSDSSVVRIYGSDGDPYCISIKGESAGTAQVTGYGVDGSTSVCYITVLPYVE